MILTVEEIDLKDINRAIMSDPICAIVMKTRMEIVKSQYGFFYKAILDAGEALSVSRKIEEIENLTAKAMKTIDKVFKDAKRASDDAIVIQTRNEIVIQTRMEIVKLQYDFFYTEIVNGVFSTTTEDEIENLTAKYMKVIDKVLEDHCAMLADYFV